MNQKTTTYWFHRVEVKLTLLVQSPKNEADIETFFKDFYEASLRDDVEAITTEPDVITSVGGAEAKVELVKGDEIECVDVTEFEE